MWIKHEDLKLTTNEEKNDFKDIWEGRTGYLTYDNEGFIIITSQECDNYTPVKVVRCDKKSILLRVLR